jgi:alpha-mannosidase
MEGSDLKGQKGIVYLAGHAHIDLSWLWTRNETIHDICPRTFNSILELMEKYPFFCFSQSGAQIYTWMEKYYPKTFGKIKRFIEKGLWEIVGGSWVEHNATIISGESLVRQYLYGKRYFMKKFSVDVKVAWLPDCFGFSWSMPQILKKCGIEYFMTYKLKWQIERMKPPIPFPYYIFWWQAADGSKVLAYHTIGTYSENVDEKIMNQLEVMKKVHGLNRIMVVYGHGDHGGGPSEEMIQQGVALSKSQGAPNIRFSAAKEFFDDVKLLMEENGCPTVNDELYVKTHRGTFTTESFVKKANRESETLLMNAEKLATLAIRFGSIYPHDKLAECWERILFGQVHDQIDGTSIDAVYWDAATDYTDIYRVGQEVLYNSLKRITEHINTEKEEQALIVFNSLAWKRNDIVKVQVDPEDISSLHISDMEGNRVPYQVIEENGDEMLVFFAKNVPALGYKTYEVKRGKLIEKEIDIQTDLFAGNNFIENEFYKVEIDPKTGCLSNVFDKQNKIAIFDKFKQGNCLEIYEDQPPEDAQGGGEPAWNIYLGRRMIPELSKVEVLEKGPVRCRLQINKNFGSSSLIQDVILYTHTPRIDFEIRIDWHEHMKFAKVSFPLNISSLYATYEVPYGAIQRFDHTLHEPSLEISMPQRKWEEADKAKFEVAALNWVNITDKSETYGVSLLNDSKQGFSFENNVLRMSLVRGQRRGYVMKFQRVAMTFDEWSDQSDKPIVGLHKVRYAIFGHKGDWRTAATPRRGYEFNYPLIAIFESAHSGELPPSHSFIEVSPENVILTVVKKAEDTDEVVLRLYDSYNVETEATIYFDMAPTAVRDTDLMEWGKYVKEKVIPIKGNSITVPMAHSEIKTLKVRF